MRRLLASGWWVVPAALIICCVTVWLVLRTADGVDAGLGDGRNPATYGFDLSGLRGQSDTLVAGGVPRDHLPTLVDPRVMTVAEVATWSENERGKLLVPDDPVAGLVIGDEARAWPLRLLKRHEVVNDRLDGTPVVVISAPLAGLVVAAERRLGGVELVLASSGLLVDSIPLYFDRRPDAGSASLWHPVDARAVSGPLAGERLPLLPLQVVRWDRWLAEHPDTTVLAPIPEMKKLYRRDPYHSYTGSDLLHFPVAPLLDGERGSLKDSVVVIGQGAEVAAMRLADLEAAARAGPWVGRVLGHRLSVDADTATRTALISRVDGERLGLAVRQVYAFAWHATHPELELTEP